MKEVIILGGGIAGLYTALNYEALGYKVTLIEKSDRLGGNIHTIERDGSLLETGAGRFNTDHKRLLTLLKRYGLTTYVLGVQKDFYPVLCSSSKVNVDLSIQKVILESKKLSKELLYNITFHQLCEMVLGYEKAKTLVEAFGYNAEFLIENAHASLKTFQEDFTNQYPYMICVEGLSELIKRIEEDLLSKGVTIYKNKKIEKITERNHRFYVTSNQTLKADVLVLALPKNALMKLPILDDYAKTLLDSVQSVALHRIYGKYSKPWFKELSKFTTDLPLRQFIPIDSEKGIAMVSYSDLFDADYWKYYADQGSELLETELKKQIQSIVKKNIPRLEWVESFYWKDGVHVWLPGINPTTIRRELLTFHPNLYIVGETYSLRQGWIEGALETVDEMMNHLKKKGGSYKRLLKGKEYVTISELKQMDFKWVLLTIDGKTRVIDVTEWMYQHPGTAQPFIQYMYKDITKPFHKIGSHFENKELKQHVLKMIDKFTVSQIQ